MIPSTLHSEKHVTQIEIQDEIKTIEIKKSTNNSLSSVRYSGLLRQENEKECKKDSETIKVVNGNASLANVQVCGKLFTSTNVYKMEIGDANDRKKGLHSKKNKPVLYPTRYWVQYGALKEADEPLDYGPDLNSFVAKAFFITFIMFFCTAAFVNFVWYSDRLRLIFLDRLVGKALLVAGVLGLLALGCALMCSSCMRIFPFNYIVLIIVVKSLSLVVAYITASYNIVVFAYSLAAVTVTVFACMLLALTSFDFTKFTIYLFVIGIAYTVLAVILLFTSVVLGSKLILAHIAILYILTSINVVFLVIELQTILASKSIVLCEDEYAFAAFLLYTSIYDLCFKIFQIIDLFYQKSSF